MNIIIRSLSLTFGEYSLFVKIQVLTTINLLVSVSWAGTAYIVEFIIQDEKILLMVAAMSLMQTNILQTILKHFFNPFETLVKH